MLLGVTVWSRPLPYMVPGTREVCSGRMNEGVSETRLSPQGAGPGPLPPALVMEPDLLGDFLSWLFRWG